MVSVTPTARDIENTAESLQEDLARLEIQRQALERELAAVTAHLDSVQRALAALQALLPGTSPSAVPAPAAVPAPPVDPAPEAAAEDAGGRSAAGPADSGPVPAPEPAATPSPAATAATASSASASAFSASAEAGKSYGKLTEQILAYFAENAGTDVRARDVASALGRDTDSGSINAVRSTLDRLVGSSRVRRVGRGLYRAVKQ
ncbi:hypothetical protein J7I94_00320 [Streptomyces sp. ISL-12]|uniref:hypothetical protein n=1 Tax=Streptomyces sp. ISL-12 TaxID=2819177 RepID=UPI001BE5B7DF|nr:hypothetical protein [Streptomyces sp. ISL-12]MBT2409015.1 hypothetical protein [Streptomyces sp. ISL-12]